MQFLLHSSPKAALSPSLHCMSRWSLLGERNQDNFGLCYQALWVCFLAFPWLHKVHIHKGWALDSRKKKKSKKKLKTSVKTSVWTNKGLIFTTKKVKVTRLTFTLSYCGDKRIHHKASSTRSTIGSWLENARVQLTMKNELPLCLNKKTPTWSHQARSTATFQARCVTAHRMWVSIYSAHLSTHKSLYGSH